jgi:hypothetical protein
MTQTESVLDGVRNRSLPVRTALAGVLGVVLNAALVQVAAAASIAPDFRALTLPPVAFLSILGVVGAAVVYVLLGRYVEDRDRTFTRVAAVVLVLSFLPDIALLAVDPAATALGVVVLMVMHVVVAGTTVGLIPAGDR